MGAVSKNEVISNLTFPQVLFGVYCDVLETSANVSNAAGVLPRTRSNGTHAHLV